MKGQKGYAVVAVGRARGLRPVAVMRSIGLQLYRWWQLAEQRRRLAILDDAAFRPFGEDVLVNLSVWRDVQALSDYVYTSAHTEMLKRRQEWFSKVGAAHMVLWWVPAGHRPSVQEAFERLELLRKQGASAQAFSFRQAFAPPVACEA